MNNLQVIEIKGQRLLTTKQLAEAYETDVKTVQYNFRYHKSKFQVSKHYIVIEGKDLQEMKRRNEIPSSFTKQVKHLYLWTEKGALLHAKSINTDKAWEVYDYLVDFYFRAKEVKEQKPVQESGMLLVDVPDNVKIQEAMKEVGKYLTATEVALQEYNKYRTEESYNNQRQYLTDLFGKVQVLFWDMLNIKPETVRKGR